MDEVEEWSDQDDDTYEYENSVDDDELSFDDVEDVVEDSIVDIPNEDPLTDQPSQVLPTDHTEDVAAPLIQPPITDDHTNGEITGVEDVDPMADAIHFDDMMKDHSEAAGQITGVEERRNADDVSDGTVDYDSTEEAEYEKAERLGIESAHNDDMSLPKRVRKKKTDEIYEYYNVLVAGIDVDQVFCSYDDDHTKQVFNFLTDQMSTKAGLKEFGEKGAALIMEELEQLLYRMVIVGRKASDLTSSQRKATLQYLMFLKEKHCGKVKARGSADGRKQRVYKTKDETSSPTMNVEALFITCLIGAMEGREVMTCNISGAFMQSEMDELIHMKLKGEIALLLI